MALLLQGVFNMNMKTIKNLLQKGGYNKLTNDEQREVVAFLVKILGSTEESIKNWIRGGLPRSSLNGLFDICPMEYWGDMNDILNIIYHQESEKKEEVKQTKGLSSTQYCEAIHRMPRNIKGVFFRRLREDNYEIYETLSQEYSNYCKYTLPRGKSSLRKHANVPKPQKGTVADLQNRQRVGLITLNGKIMN